KRTASGTWQLHTSDDERAAAVSAAQPRLGLGADDHDLGLSVTAQHEHAIAALSVALVESGLGIIELHQHVASLEDLFFALTEQPETDVRQHAHLEVAS